MINSAVSIYGISIHTESIYLYIYIYMDMDKCIESCEIDINGINNG